jgi:hypothetical protein
MPKVWLVKSNGKGLDFGSDTHRATFHEDLKDNVGKTYRIERVVPTRTLSQNALYWFYLGVIESETGNNANDMHEFFRRTLLKPKLINVMGKEIRVPSSTTELTKVEFGEYMDRICAETNVPIPNPEDAGYVSNY